ncbi:MAG: hemolysin family protein [Alphaproteobacteria bacterium]
MMDQPTPRSAPSASVVLVDGEEPPSRLRQALVSLREKFAKRQPPPNLREAVEELIEEGSAADNMSPAERLLLANMLRLREQTVADCMKPRADIIAAEIDTSLADLARIMAESQHSRIPVYRETLDDVLGMVHMKDVMNCLAKGEDCKIKDLLRQVLFVPPSTAVIRLLLQMRTARHYMAMVVDEFGGIDGIVTIEDLVEEIVGEINDEHDEVARPQIIVRADGSMLIEARLPIEDFEQRVGKLLSEEERAEIDTVGGLVFLIAGRMPRVGESFTHSSGIRFDVLEVDHSRILRLRARNLPVRALPPQSAPLKRAGGAG